MPWCARSARASPRIIIGRAIWPRFRPPCSAAGSSSATDSLSADPSPALLLADDAEHAAPDDQGRTSEQADGRGRVDVALGVEHLAPEGAVAGRLHR